jgi:sn-1 stearoyl-lipid 9-desaturase
MVGDPSLHLAALTVFLPGSFTWSAVGAMLVLHWLTGGVGITFGYHRLITHRSFRAPRWLEHAVLFCGTLAGQPVFYRVGHHRMHHQHADSEADPHKQRQGFLVGTHRLDAGEAARQSASVRALHLRHQPRSRVSLLEPVLHSVAGASRLPFISLGGWPFVVWGVFVRFVVVYNCTWAGEQRELAIHDGQVWLGAGWRLR